MEIIPILLICAWVYIRCSRQALSGRGCAGDARCLLGVQAGRQCLCHIEFLGDRAAYFSPDELNGLYIILGPDRVCVCLCVYS